LKIQETQQDLRKTIKREQKRFTLPQGLRPVSYTTIRISTIKRSN